MAPSMLHSIAITFALFASCQQIAEGARVLDLTNGQSQFLGEMKNQVGMTNAALPNFGSMNHCAKAMNGINVILADQHALESSKFQDLIGCYKTNILSNEQLPLFIFEGEGSNLTLSEIFGFAPHMEGALLSVFQKVNRQLLIVDQLSDLEGSGAHFDGKISEVARSFDTEGELISENETLKDAVLTKAPENRRLRGGSQMGEMLNMYLENLASKIPAFGFVQEDARAHQIQMAGDSNAPVDTMVILLDHEATMAIPQVGRCSYSKTYAPAPQPNNFVRNWLEITLAIDQPANGGDAAIGQYVNVYHKNEVVTNMARRPGTNHFRSIDWFVGYNKITHYYDTNKFFTSNYSPQNVPMNADVSFSTSFTHTVAAASGDPPTLSYSQSKTEGTTVKYTVSDWEVTKVSESANSNGWYHTNNKPYNGRDYSNKFPPTKSNLFNCQITNDGKFYDQKSCNPYWASVLATDDGICEQNILYRTKANTGYQTQPATFSYQIQTQWSALESWGNSGMFGSKWEACAYFQNYYSGVLNFVVQMNQVQPTLI